MRIWLERAELAVTGTMLMVIVGTVFSASVLRYAGHPVHWSMELSQALFVWLAMLAANQALRNRAHVAVDLLSGLIAQAPWLELAITIIHRLLILSFLGLIIYYGYQLAAVNTRRMLPSMGISYAWVTAAIPVGSVLLLLTTLGQLIEDIRHWYPGPPADSHESPLP